MVSGAKKPGLPSKAEASGWPTAGVLVLGRFKGKQVPLGSKLLLTLGRVLLWFHLGVPETGLFNIEMTAMLLYPLVNVYTAME